ncbi:hypothetical protein [Sphingomonas beigongshangi]|uniref:hypothetical protein n=1 Tax=Sphingomonas beigongshangi TaxID=2782540 RepID=UPI00193BAAB3|nr:hypothetical protein [Sphingomonas beigongshangi]
MSLGGKNLPDAWNANVRKKYRNRALKAGLSGDELDISKICKAKTVKDALLKKYPFLHDWKECPYRWHVLQFEESSILLDALYRLTVVHDIPALPLHDAMIVKESDMELAKQEIRKYFHRRFSVYPEISFKKRR